MEVSLDMDTIVNNLSPYCRTLLEEALAASSGDSIEIDASCQDELQSLLLSDDADAAVAEGLVDGLLADDGLDYIPSPQYSYLSSFFESDMTPLVVLVFLILCLGGYFIFTHISRPKKNGSDPSLLTAKNTSKKKKVCTPPRHN
jgi:hypothetical protein